MQAVLETGLRREVSGSVRDGVDSSLARQSILLVLVDHLRLLRFAAGLGLASLYLNLVNPVVVLAGESFVLRLLSPCSCLFRNLV